ncbi:MAG TPA: hypothetical protein C5S37_02365 [Methanophagales archaeon]|nr:hypothetical protein [Methanophagales archaeon]
MEYNESGRITNYEINRVKESFGIGLFDSPIGTKENGMGYSKFLNPGEEFKGYVFLSNQMYDGNDFLISCLLDYKQVPFKFDEEDKQVLHIIHLEPFEERFYSFDLGKIEKGGHDFEIVAIMKPYEHSLNRTFRFSTDFSYLGSGRKNLFVGTSNNLPVINYTNLSAISCSSEYPLNNGILITKEPCSAKAWLTEEVKPGERLNYTINVAADREYLVSFAIMVLLDYEQVPINVNGSNSIIFGKLDAGEKVSIPASIIVPDKKGVHELMVVWFTDPNERLETSPGVRAHIRAGTEPSIRVGLNVKDFRSENLTY